MKKLAILLLAAMLSTGICTEFLYAEGESGECLVPSILDFLVAIVPPIIVVPEPVPVPVPDYSGPYQNLPPDVFPGPVLKPNGVQEVQGIDHYCPGPGPIPHNNNQIGSVFTSRTRRGPIVAREEIKPRTNEIKRRTQAAKRKAEPVQWTLEELLCGQFFGI